MRNLLVISQALRTALNHRPVRLGLLGTLCIAIGSLTPAYLPQVSPMWPVLRQIHLAGPAGRVIGTMVTILGIVLLVHGWLSLRQERYIQINPRAIVAVWSLPFLVCPPVFSHDMYSYGAQGWMIHHGQNPYYGGPGLVPGPFSDYVSWVWRFTPAPYGPLGLQISRVIVEISGGQPWLAAMLMRVPAILGVVAIVVLLPKIARRLNMNEARVIWFACLNPLVIIDFVGGGHNDAWMMGLVVLGLWVAVHPRWWALGAVVIGLAAACKQPAIMAAVFLPLMTKKLESWRDIRRAGIAVGTSVVSVGISVGVFLVITWASGLGLGWISAMSVPGTVSSISPSFLVGRIAQWLVDPLGTSIVAWTSKIAMGVGAVLIIYFTLRYGPRQPIRALSWSWLALALSVSALHSWYFLWGGLLYPMSSTAKSAERAGVLLVILMLFYAGLNHGERNGLHAGIAAIVCLGVWVLFALFYRQFKKRTGFMSPI
ncbi:MAG: polyprenol phosphomannose-dependent alpha 1,6 mannosyltransferase MptB [Propionibacteriaceae bacterium]|nr:polyprenol phosphomannose-dependent alpha 1,6 mannosyltransferase MptB [Propionibacteriaceae bacterium]